MPSLDERVAILEHRQDTTEARLEQYIRDAHGQRMKLIAASEAACEMSRKIMADTQALREIESDIRVLARAVRFVAACLRWMTRWIVLPSLAIYAVLYAATHQGAIPDWLRSLIKTFAP